MIFISGVGSGDFCVFGMFLYEASLVLACLICGETSSECHLLGYLCFLFICFFISSVLWAFSVTRQLWWSAVFPWPSAFLRLIIGPCSCLYHVGLKTWMLLASFFSKRRFFIFFFLKVCFRATKTDVKIFVMVTAANISTLGVPTSSKWC